MSKPRYCPAGGIHHISHGVVNGYYAWSPQYEKITELFYYAVAVACLIYNVKCLALVQMSNHINMQVWDIDGRLPDFMWLIGRIVSVGTFNINGFGPCVMHPGSYSSVLVGDMEGAAKVAAYIIANPVAAGLVDEPEEWEGLNQTIEQLGTFRKTIQRPDCTRSHKLESLPEEVDFVISMPPRRFAKNPREWQREVRAAMKEVRATIAKARKGKRSLGMARAKERGKEYCRGPFKRKHGLYKPEPIANCGCDELQQRIETHRENWLDRYHEALMAKRAGREGVPFPYGTWARCQYDNEPTDILPDPDIPLFRH